MSSGSSKVLPDVEQNMTQILEIWTSEDFRPPDFARSVLRGRAEKGRTAQKNVNAFFQTSQSVVNSQAIFT